MSPEPEDTPPGDPSPGRDALFADPRGHASDFSFDDATAAVFDDMVNRSVPLYGEVQRMTSEIAADFAVAGTKLFDLGCATATSLLSLDRAVDPAVRFVGVDNSPEMLAKARDKLVGYGVTRDYELLVADLERGPVVHDASVVLMNFTLQFIRPLYRERVIRDVYNGMNDQGCLIIVEKLILGDGLFNRLFIRYYYDMKRRQGYSDLEIAQKREALENVLIPFRPEENRELVANAGFRHVEEFFRWYNFCGLVAVK
jgi:tRNA (cmo5U34)-methyltransferase